VYRSYGHVAATLLQRDAELQSEAFPILSCRLGQFEVREILTRSDAGADAKTFLKLLMEGEVLVARSFGAFRNFFTEAGFFETDLRFFDF